jgi:hypothetical protein
LGTQKNIKIIVYLEYVQTHAGDVCNLETREATGIQVSFLSQLQPQAPGIKAD